MRTPIPRCVTYSLSGVTSADLVPGGSGGHFTVSITGLQSNKMNEYVAHVAP